MSDADFRNEASSKQFKSLDQLRKHCDRIQQGWFRCQAFVDGGRHLSNSSERKRAFILAEKAALTESDPYRQCAPAAWPIAALFEFDFRNDAEAMAKRTFQRIEAVTPNSSKACAIELVIQAAWPLGQSFRNRVVHQLFSMLNNDPFWRVRVACEEIASFLVYENELTQLQKELQNCADPKSKRRIQRIIDSQKGYPRSDFIPIKEKIKGAGL
tara:strand:+ start:627 stop:1265 length:639 start_codon:yes stop_codon:yes gene_type:complete